MSLQHDNVIVYARALSRLDSCLQLLAAPPDFPSRVPVFARRRGVLQGATRRPKEGSNCVLAPPGVVSPTRGGRRVHHTLGPSDDARGGRVHAGRGLRGELARPAVQMGEH